LFAAPPLKTQNDRHARNLGGTMPPCPLAQNRRQKVFNKGILRLFRETWYSEIW